MSGPQPTTREQLYERIRNSSKDEVILAEMIRLGFWPEQGTLPVDPADEIRRRAELEKRLDELRKQARNLQNERHLLAQARKKRLQESRKKQQETKARREQERKTKAEAWQQRKQQEIVYLGEGVSAGLSQHETNPQRLANLDLPLCKTPQELAERMGIPLGQLRFLAFARRVAQKSHYQRFLIAKKTGGTRKISAPMPRLKAAQTWILQHILNKVPAHDAVHGFCLQRSICSNAKPHVGAEVVINLDLKDFFPTVSYPRVKGVFRGLGYGESVATVLALLCTEPEVEEVVLDGERYFIAQSERFLPQGSPASPAVTNILCRRLDRRLAQLAANNGFQYTRYADDLTFSAAKSTRSAEIGRMLRAIHDILKHEGFTVHPHKTRVMRKSRRQEVTGLVVNDKLGIERKTLRKFRATLFQLEKDGLQGKHWGESGKQGMALLESIDGFAKFIHMVDPQKGAPLLAQVQRIKTKEGYQRPAPRFQKRSSSLSPLSAEKPAETANLTEEMQKTDGSTQQTAKKKWWKLW